MRRRLAPLRILKKLPMLLDRIAASVRRASLWNCGDRTRPGLARRRRSLAAGLGAAAAPRLRSIRGPSRLGCSAPSAPPRARPPGWSCRNATPPRCRSISRKFPRRSHRAPTRWSCSIKPGGINQKKLKVPDNITLLPLPPKCPELNPTENIWQYMCGNWRSNRIFQSYKDIVDHCCHVWNTHTDRPWLIMSIGMRDWAHGF